MSKYPVETSDLDGVVAGVNYLLSGPAGLGQNFSGKSFGTSGDLSASPRGPYILPYSSTFTIYNPPISLSSSEMLDELTFKFTFSSTQSFEPFYIGQPVTVKGVTDDTYNNTYSPIGVLECTTDYVIVRGIIPYDVVSPSTGGTVELDIVSNFIPIVTDCQATVTITGATDRVFLSGQIEFRFSYNCIADCTLFVSANIVRTPILSTSTVGSSMYFDEIPVINFSQNYTYDLLAGDSDLIALNSIFTSFIDQDYQGVTPDKGLYNYSLQLSFNALPAVPGPTVIITEVNAGTRTLTAQVVKQ